MHIPIHLVPSNPDGFVFSPWRDSGWGRESQEAICLLLWLCAIHKWLPLLPGLSLKRWRCLPFHGWREGSDQWTQMYGTPKKIQTGLYLKFQKIKYNLYRLWSRWTWMALLPVLSNPHPWTSLPRSSACLHTDVPSKGRVSPCGSHMLLSSCYPLLTSPVLRAFTSSFSSLLGQWTFPQQFSGL